MLCQTPVPLIVYPHNLGFDYEPSHMTMILLLERRDAGDAIALLWLGRGRIQCLRTWYRILVELFGCPLPRPSVACRSQRPE